MEPKGLSKALERFEPITLPEMDDVKLMDRIDTKFSFPRSSLLKMLILMQKDYRVLEVANTRLPKYRTLYFDDQELTSFVEHHEQLDDRYKIRFREYSESKVTFLEVKHRVGLRTEKTRIPSSEIKQKFSKEQIEFINSAGVKGKRLYPKLYNNFNRMTFVNKNSAERVTLDINIVYKWNGNKEKMRGLVIAELKQPELNKKSPFWKLMKKNGIEDFRVSKYCTGIMLMQGETNMKVDRFKKKLSKIESIAGK